MLELLAAEWPKFYVWKYQFCKPVWNRVIFIEPEYYTIAQKYEIFLLHSNSGKLQYKSKLLSVQYKINFLQEPERFRRQ